MTEPSLEQRLARVEARLDIEELLTRYALLLDDHEFDAVGELFTEAGRFGSPESMHEGRAAIVANYRVAAQRYPLSLHEAHGLVLDELGDDTARGTVIGFSEQASGAATIVTSVRYCDVYARLDGRWMFAEREVRTLYAMTHAERAGGGLARPLRKRWPHRDPQPAHLPVHMDDRGTDG